MKGLDGLNSDSKNNPVSLDPLTLRNHLDMHECAHSHVCTVAHTHFLPGAQGRSWCLWEAMGFCSRLGHLLAATLRLREGLRPRATLWSGLCIILVVRWRVGPWRMQQRGGGWGPTLRQVRRHGCGALAFHTLRGTQERAKYQAQPGKNLEDQPVPGSRLHGWASCFGGVQSLYLNLPPNVSHTPHFSARWRRPSPEI